MTINLSIGFMSFAISFGVYLVMFALFLIGQRDSPKGKPFVTLIFISVLWSGLLMLSQMDISVALELIVFAELIRFAVWIFVLQYAMGCYVSKSKMFSFDSFLSPISLIIIFVFSCILLIFNHNIVQLLQLHNVILIEILLLFVYPIIGLVIVEQLYKSTPKEERWNIRVLCIAAAAIFIFDVFVFSDALLWGELNYDFWSARGIVNVLVLPLIILSAVRNPTLAPKIYISRHVVFHSTALMVAGAYLVLVSFAAYFIKAIGGEWGSLLQISFVFAGILFLVLILSSKSIRLHIKNYLYANFFSNKYDYRDEWHRFSNTLLKNTNKSINERALISVCQIMDSQGGALWLVNEGHIEYSACWNMVLNAQQKKVPQDFIENTLVKKDIYLCKSEKEDRYFNQINNAWFILPLRSQDNLIGFALFQTPQVNRVLDAEDKELLKTVSDHIALFFSQHHTSFQLMEAQKFQHISQMTAFLVHDLKTVLSQLLLMSENAKIHKSNPEFIDDMLKTIEHVAKKMQRLILQLKEPEAVEKLESFEVVYHLQQMLDEYNNHSVTLDFKNNIGEINIKLNKDAFISAIKHIVQNAIDASDKYGHVDISMRKEDQSVFISIKDKGCGMTEEFMAEHLFRPFDSSKGVTGMGVGVYQSRQYFRSIGGDVSVISEENIGSEFNIEIPLGMK